jgi:hypothetical protein
MAAAKCFKNRGENVNGNGRKKCLRRKGPWFFEEGEGRRL